MDSNQVVIIGAGLAGLSLAIALHQRSIPCKVYESRQENVKLGGAVMLSPNALRVLDQIGVYDRIKEKGFRFETLDMKTDSNVHLDTYYFGSAQKFGYTALRIYRQVIVNELVSILKENGIPIEFEKKYRRVVSETSTGVEVEFADGSTITTPLLVGTDGIHSHIREYIAPGVQPKYLGVAAMAGAVKTSNVRLPSSDYVVPASIFGKKGVFILAQQDVDSSEMMAGTQYAMPEPSREDMKSTPENRQKIIDKLRRDKSEWSDVVQSAMENMIPESMYMWPFYQVPSMPKWTSEAGKVVVIGDAAHAIPPTIGQGANQAFEEGLGLAITIEKIRAGASEQLLHQWMKHRVSRIGQLMEMTRKMNNNRLPKEQAEKLDPVDLWQPDAENPGEEMRWLYAYDVQQSIDKDLGV